MSILPRPFAALALLLAALPAAGAQPATAASPGQTSTVVIETTAGDIHIALDHVRAPKTSQNFLAYVDSGLFSRMTFYRASASRSDGSEGMIQGGMGNNLRGTMPPVPHEPTYTTGLSHMDSAVSMAYTSNPGSARTEFFIVVGSPIPSYDGVPGGKPGYAVFGKVTKGMDVVRRILKMPKTKDARNAMLEGSILVEPVAITRARRAP
ncbi:MAG: peptidylprolyl isomerase [Pseudomonadota bacterium]|nr:peptidylprolyl isomerase [Pseudomonadota bacterium]